MNNAIISDAWVIANYKNNSVDFYCVNSDLNVATLNASIKLKVGDNEDADYIHEQLDTIVSRITTALEVAGVNYGHINMCINIDTSVALYTMKVKDLTQRSGYGPFDARIRIEFFEHNYSIESDVIIIDGIAKNYIEYNDEITHYNYFLESLKKMKEGYLHD